MYNYPRDEDETNQTKEKNNGPDNTSKRPGEPLEHQPERRPGTGREDDEDLDPEGMAGD